MADSVEPKVVRVTTCSSCPFDVSSFDSMDKDHCRLLGYNHPDIAGGFRVPPESCPLRIGVQFELDLEEAQKRCDDYAAKERARYLEEVQRMLKEEQGRKKPDKRLVKQLQEILTDMEG